MSDKIPPLTGDTLIVIGGFVLTVCVNVATVFWWGGRLDARVTHVERRTEQAIEYIDKAQERDTAQETRLATIHAQYAEIIRRLDRLETGR